MFAESIFDGEPGSACCCLYFPWHKFIELLGRSPKELDFFVMVLFLSFSHLKKRMPAFRTIRCISREGNSTR